LFDDIISNYHDHKPAESRLGLRKLKKEKVGIVCDDAGKVVEMHLGHMGISGPISAELGLLQSLERLNLIGNYLTGTIPNSIGGVYAHNHAHTAIDGEDQKKFVLNEALEFLDLAGNLLVGPIPDTLGSLPRLESLFLHSNRIHGEKIPSSICQRFNSESFNGDGEDDDADRGTGDFKAGLWADCGQKFDAIQCDCCTYCCNSSLTHCIPNNG
jgi:Leucine-rich repeat (LRR) protein